jgi:hypothetical protein
MHKLISILSYIAVFLLLVALLAMPFGYYTFLRITVTAISIYGAYCAWYLSLEKWAVIWGLVAILFNPLFPVYFTRQVWLFLDASAAAFIYYGVRKIISKLES